MNRVFLIGNLTKDPEVAVVSNDLTNCKFSIAVTRRYGAKETDYFTIVCWRAMAENCGKYLRTGRKVCPFCVNKVDEVDYITFAKDLEKNSEKNFDRSGERRPRFVAENGKIIPRRTSGVCVKHQRDIAVAIKRARIMALLPFKGE